MTPFASVAMLEKFTLLKIAVCKALASRRLFAPDLVADIQAADDVVVGKRGIVDSRGHVPAVCTTPDWRSLYAADTTDLLILCGSNYGQRGFRSPGQLRDRI
jgi:hypothetical protein